MKSIVVHILNCCGCWVPAKFTAFKSALYRVAGMRLGRGVNLGFGLYLGYYNVNIADRVWVGPWCKIYSTPRSAVVIHENVDVGPEVSFVTGSHEMGDSTRRAGSETSCGIVVGAGSWIGARACILGGAELGKGTIVAAGSVVLRGKYPAHVLLAGVPARVKKSLA